MNTYIGIITKVLYRNQDFLIAKLQTDKEELVIKGSIYGVDKGEEIQVQGAWEMHRNLVNNLRLCFGKGRYRKQKIRLSHFFLRHL